VLDISYCLTAHISTHGVWSDYLSLNRLSKYGPYTIDERSDLKILLPHLSRAAELHRWITKLESIHGAVLSVLDKLLVGLVILDDAQRVVVFNHMSSKIAEISGAFSTDRDGRLRLYDQDKKTLLDKILRTTADTATKGGKSDGKQLVLKKRCGSGNILFEIMPIRDDGISDREGIRGTVIVIIDPDQSQALSADALKTIFNFTSSETQIVKALINGLSVNEIAEERKTKTNTVREQLKSVFSKSGSKNQLDLFRKATLANPPIEKNS
jgi:DNA-binding CsgD family transcriptional regulator